MFQKQFKEDMPQMLPEVEAALVERIFQEVGAPKAEPKAETVKVSEQRLQTQKMKTKRKKQFPQQSSQLSGLLLPQDMADPQGFPLGIGMK